MRRAIHVRRCMVEEALKAHNDCLRMHVGHAMPDTLRVFEYEWQVRDDRRETYVGRAMRFAGVALLCVRVACVMALRRLFENVSFRAPL